jgi:hypothetical protein
VCPLLEEPVTLHIMCAIKEESNVASLTADVVVNGTSAEFDCVTDLEERTCKNVDGNYRKSRSPFKHHRSTGQASAMAPVRRPPPIAGVCFEIFKSGTCEAHKIGRCAYDHSADALAAQMKKYQDNMNAFLASSSDINDAIPASLCTEQGSAPLEITGDVEVEVHSPPKEPYVVVAGTVTISDSFEDIAVPEPTKSIIAPVLEQVGASTRLLCGSNVISCNFHIVTGRAYLRSIGLFDMLFDAACGSVMLFEGWPMSMLSEGFPPGPPKKPPPWFPVIKILVIFGTSNLWFY